MTTRDKLIVKLLHHFRVLSRDQLGTLICPEVAKPYATVNRIMKRLCRDGIVLPIPQPKDRPYLYMPNPTIIHPNSTRTNHFLAIVDFYIRIGQPNIYEVEPDLKHDYRPDAYTILNNEHIAVEVQLSHTSNKKIQEKVDGFVDSCKKGKHAARKLWLVTDRPFKYNVPEGYQVEVLPLTEVKEKGTYAM